MKWNSEKHTHSTQTETTAMYASAQAYSAR